MKCCCFNKSIVFGSSVLPWWCIATFYIKVISATAARQSHSEVKLKHVPTYLAIRQEGLASN